MHLYWADQDGTGSFNGEKQKDGIIADNDIVFEYVTSAGLSNRLRRKFAYCCKDERASR